MGSTAQKILFQAWIVASALIGIAVGIVVERYPKIPVDSVTAGFIACFLCLFLPLIIFLALQRKH
jgi:hypothetical protein